MKESVSTENVGAVADDSGTCDDDEEEEEDKREAYARSARAREGCCIEDGVAPNIDDVELEVVGVDIDGRRADAAAVAAELVVVETA